MFFLHVNVDLRGTHLDKISARVHSDLDRRDSLENVFRFNGRYERLFQMLIDGVRVFFLLLPFRSLIPKGIHFLSLYADFQKPSLFHSESFWSSSGFQQRRSACSTDLESAAHALEGFKRTLLRMRNLSDYYTP